MPRQLFEYHDRLAYRFIPGLKARMPHEGGGYMVRVNEMGFRSNREFETRRTPGKRRVLLFGDSFTAGDGVSNPQRYSDVLEQLLPDVEIYNFGLPSSGTDQQYLAWQEFGRQIECDLVIVAVLVENIRRVAAKYRQYRNEQEELLVYSKPYFEVVDGVLTLRNVPPDPAPKREEDLPASERTLVDHGGRFMQARKLVRALGLQELAQRVTGYQPLPEYDDANHPAWIVMRSILERWSTECAQPMLVMPLPLYQYIEDTADPSSYRQRFAEMAAASGVALHDPLDDLRRYSMEERRRFRFEKDIHLTPAGHAALARSLAPVLPEVLQSMARGVTA